MRSTAKQIRRGIPFQRTCGPSESKAIDAAYPGLGFFGGGRVEQRLINVLCCTASFTYSAARLFSRAGLHRLVFLNVVVSTAGFFIGLPVMAVPRFI